MTPADIASVSPTLAAYTKSKIVDELWQRPGLSRKDRYVVTLSTLISRAQTVGMAHYFNNALDDGVTPAEISEIVTHLAFYTGWSTAFAAIDVLKELFAQRGIDAAELPEVAPRLLSLDEAVPDEAARVGFIGEAVGPVSPALQHFTDKPLSHEVWLRPGLDMRDRNLITIASLIALGQLEFLPFYLGRAVAKGIGRDQLGEIIGHIAFYAGWPFAISAAGVVKGFFTER